MKRLKIILAVMVVVVVAAVVVLLIVRPTHDPYAPKFVALSALPAGPLGNEYIYAKEALPFRDGKAWIHTAGNSTNAHDFLYDLDRHAVSGELLGGAAVMANEDHTRFLCEGIAPPTSAFRQKINSLLNRFAPKWFPGSTSVIETFWLLDIRKNSAVPLGELSQELNITTAWREAPGFRFGYNVPSDGDEDRAFVLCDLEGGTFGKVALAGSLMGWWNDHQILFENAATNFMLFDVLTRKTTTLLTARDVEQTLQRLKIPVPTNGITAWPHWNGQGYDFFFMAEGTSRETGHSFLLRTSSESPVQLVAPPTNAPAGEDDHARPRLSLFARDFQFGRNGSFNLDGTLYAFGSGAGSPGDGGVVLRDVAKGTERVLVPPASTPQYAVPRFYGDSVVIYRRDSALWSIGIEETNGTRLLPADK